MHRRSGMTSESLIGILETRKFLGKIEKKVNTVAWPFSSPEIVKSTQLNFQQELPFFSTLPSLRTNL